MPKDYARYVNKPKRPVLEHGWRRRLLLVGFLLLLLISAASGFYVYQHHKANFAQQSVGNWVKKVKLLFIKTSSEQDVSKLKDDSSQTVEQHEQDAEIQFSFYTNLPTMQVSASQAAPTQVAVEEKIKLPALNKPVEVANVSPPVDPPIVSQRNVVDEKYLLQIAAFANPTAAGEMRISLLLAGFEVEIVKAMRNNQQLYQLQQGPFSTMAQVKARQRELEKKGIESVVVKKIT
jgi:cell division protein FtsN